MANNKHLSFNDRLIIENNAEIRELNKILNILLGNIVRS